MFSKGQRLWVEIWGVWVPGLFYKEVASKEVSALYEIEVFKKELVEYPLTGPLPLHALGNEHSDRSTLFRWGLRVPRERIHTEDEHSVFVLTI